MEVFVVWLNAFHDHRFKLLAVLLMNLSFFWRHANLSLRLSLEDGTRFAVAFPKSFLALLPSSLSVLGVGRTYSRLFS